MLSRFAQQLRQLGNIRRDRPIRSVSPILNTGECTATRDARATALEPFAVAANTLWHVRSREMRIAIALNSIFIVHLGFKPVSHRHSINTGAGWRSSFWPSRDDAGTDLGSFIHLLRYPYLTGLTDFRLDALRRLFSSNFINLFVLLFGRPFLFDLPLLPIGFLHRVDCSVPPKDKYGAVALNASPFSWWYIAPPSQRLYVGVSILRAAYSAPNKLRGGAGRTRTSNQTNSNALSFGCVITARWSRFPQLARFEATVSRRATPVPKATANSTQLRQQLRGQEVQSILMSGCGDLCKFPLATDRRYIRMMYRAREG